MYQGKYYISPRVQIQDAKAKYSKTKPLSKAELTAFVSAAKLIGIDPWRFSDDAVRFALDELSEAI